MYTPEVGGPTSYEVANKYGGADQVPFTQPVWASDGLPASGDGFDGRCTTKKLSASVGGPQPTGYGGKLFVTLMASASIQFILEYFHPSGMKSYVRITRPPMHGKLEQLLCAGDKCNRTRQTLALWLRAISLKLRPPNYFGLGSPRTLA